MAKVYSPPEEIKVPAFNPKTWREDDEKFMKELKEYCETHGSSDHKGKVIRFPMADSYAEYMVFSMKPCRLIHIPLGDAWHFQYINSLSVKAIEKEIAKADALKRIFG